MHLNSLPEDVLVLVFQQRRIGDVLVLVFQQRRIGDVFALRLTNRYFKNIIADYAKTILPTVAHGTIPKAKYERIYQQAGEDYSLSWLKRLAPRYLAATLLESPSFRSMKALGWSSVAADDPLGDELRIRLENGWKVLKLLSNISQAVYSPAMLQLANAFNQQTWSHIQSSLCDRLALRKGKGVQDFAFISQKEQMIAVRRSELINSLSQSDAADYMLLIRLLSKSIRYHPRFKADGSAVMSVVNSPWATRTKPTSYNWPGKLEGTYYWFADWQVDVACPIAPWVMWFIFHIGPDPFFQQWSSDYDEVDSKADHVSELAWALWKGQDTRTIKKRAQLASELDVAIRRKCLRPRKEKPRKGQNMDQLLNDTIQRGATDHKLFIREALLPDYFMRWLALGGENVQVDLSEEEQVMEDGMVARGRHPRERGPFFVYLGRELAQEAQNPSHD